MTERLTPAWYRIVSIYGKDLHGAEMYVIDETTQTRTYYAVALTPRYLVIKFRYLPAMHIDAEECIYRIEDRNVVVPTPHMSSYRHLAMFPQFQEVLNELAKCINKEELI